ncbi:MAG: hypothetical protein JWN46_802 [Acidimicrobiales bacterium]|nr:hypothetical protein [Acidimicrobiales bacterium]
MSGLYAYVDESERRGRYLMCSVIIDPSQAGALRRAVKSLLLPGQRRLHFKKEAPRRRRELATALNDLDLDVSVFVCRSANGRSESDMRRLCLQAIVDDLQRRGPATLILESRHQQDDDDHPAIAAARRVSPSLTYEHVDGRQEPLLSLPDSYAWLVGAGIEAQRLASRGIRVLHMG